MSKKIDSKDIILLDELKKNAKSSSRSLARRVNLPISTVHRRIKKLTEMGVIKKFTVDIDYEKIGQPIQALILINVEEGKNITMDEIINRLNKLGEVEEILVTYGWQFDLVARSRLKSINYLSIFIEKIREIKGVEEVSSIVVE